MYFTLQTMGMRTWEYLKKFQKVYGVYHRIHLFNISVNFIIKIVCLKCVYSVYFKILLIFLLYFKKIQKNFLRVRICYITKQIISEKINVSKGQNYLDKWVELEFKLLQI